MSDVRWAQVKALFQEAADLDPEPREACLRAFAGDPSVRDEVRALLEADAAAQYLDDTPLRLFVPAAAPHSGRRIHREAVAICRRVLGSSHPHTASAVNTLAACLSDHGELAEAATLFAEALRIRRSVLGPEHPDLAWTLYYAYLQLDRNDPGRAIALANEVLALRGRTLPESHPMIASGLQVLGQAELSRGRPEAAERAFRECLSLRRRALSAGHWLIASSEGWIGRCLLERGRIAEAEPLILRSYEQLSAALGDKHGAVKEARRRVKGLHEKIGRPAWAATLED